MKNSQFNKKETMQKIMPLIEHSCVKFNIIPLEVNLIKENGRWFLKIFIYRKDGGITHKDCENITRDIGVHLDELIPVNYFLEISSPGLERTLKSVKEYLIFKGKKATLKLKKPTEKFQSKTLKIKILDYNNHDGLIFEQIEEKNTSCMPESNISSVKLILEDNIKKERKSND